VKDNDRVCVGDRVNEGVEVGLVVREKDAVALFESVSVSVFEMVNEDVGVTVGVTEGVCVVVADIVFEYVGVRVFEGDTDKVRLCDCVGVGV
jgi:hypothetical protein